MKSRIGQKRKSFISNAKLSIEEVQANNAVQENQGKATEAKLPRKTISLAKLRSSLINRASLAGSGVEPSGLFAKPGEDSDVPYISDYSAGGL